MPDRPVTVTLNTPTAAVALAASVNVLVLVVLAGFNEAVTPLGRPDGVKATLPLKPFCGITEMVLVPLAPCMSVRPLGEVAREKFGGGGAGMVIATLSNVAVANEEVVRLLTASPTSTLCAMLTVWAEPCGTQLTPSAELYMLNTFPLLTNFIQLGRVKPERD